jgi:transposase
VTYKNKKPGRPAKGQKVEKIAVTKDNFRIILTKDPVAIEEAIYRCGYYPMITNKPEKEFSIEEAMKAHKDQYKVGHINRRSKNGYNLEPIYLHTPERIEAFLFLFKIALQVLVLIERAARGNIEQRDKGLDNFLPNRNDVRNPTTENILAAFEYVVKGEFTLPDGSQYGFVSELTEVQEDILQVLDVPNFCYSYDYIFGYN